jgi:hypothetical protein
MSEVLSHADERALYESDAAAWRVYAAPRIAASLARSTDVGLSWSLLMRETQVAVWPLMDEATQARVRAAREDLAA